MATGQLTTLVRHLERLASASGGETLSDRLLLERFASQRDEAAFRALVQRHGGLVLGVCRRVLRQPEDAEDAFQATFLVLARKARAVRWRESVAGWLYQVAYRLALELRDKAARQRQRELQAASLARSEPLPEPGWREVCTLLDKELQNLPEKYRTPLLLCYLEGDTRDQAAGKLGWSLRTFERRLQQGRELLRERLMRRGVTLSAVLLTVGLTQEAMAGRSAALAASLGRAAVQFASGGQAVTAAMSPRAVTLAEGVVRAMFLSKWQVVVAVVLALGFLPVGMGLIAPTTPGAAPQAVRPPDAPRPDPKPGGQAPAGKVEPKEAEQTESAIAAGLQWLARQQAADGHWPLPATAQNDVAGTAFGLLPLLAAGETHKQTGQFRPYARNVERGLKYLMRVQQQNDDFGMGMYAHALATWALCEAYGLTKDPQLKGPAQRAVDFIVQAQHPAGGWRYAPGQPGDTSVSSWHILALKRGESTGLRVPAETFKKASAYLDTAAREDDSYSYVPAPRGPGAGTPSMTAAALLCRLHLGWEPRRVGVVRGVAFLQKTPPGTGQVNIYYTHYATHVMEVVGGEVWQSWQPKMRKLLLDRQEGNQTDVAVRGSWPITGDPFGQAGGRLMVTSLSLLTLQTCARQDKLPPLQARDLNEQDLAALWGRLGESDFLKARHDMLVLAAAKQAVPFLKKQLRPAAAVDSRRIAQLVAGLDDPQFTAREKAAAELKTFGELARPALQEALKGQPSLETRRRVERLLDGLDREGLAPEQVRALRGVEVFVQIATPQAREVLRELTHGAPEAPLTREALAALERLSKQKRTP